MFYHCCNAPACSVYSMPMMFVIGALEMHYDDDDDDEFEKNENNSSE